MTRLNLFTAALILAAAPALAQAPAGGALTRIGAAAAVAGRVFAVPPNAKVGRVIGSGKPIFLNDHVTTDAAGRLQVLLLDETVFTLGPNSDMVLDEFVYDPDTKAGKLAANVVKGTFRFVSGHMTHEGGDNMKIHTPSGTMGIRGTIVVGQVTEGQSTLILAGPGANNNAGEVPGRIDVSNPNGSVTIDQPGQGTTVSPNTPPTPPADMSSQLAQLSGQVGAPTNGGGSKGSQSSNGGSSGGQSQGPANAGAASGQNNAETAQTAVVVNDQVGSSQDTSNLLTNANQDFSNLLADGVAYFDQLDQGILSGVLTGQDQYSMNGSYSCSGGGCGAGATGTASASIIVDWSARTIAGSGSSLTLNSAGSFTGDTINFTSVDFSTLKDHTAATFSLSGTGSGTLNSATLTLQNAGGVLAKQAAMNFTYTGSSSESASGSVSGTRAPYSVPQ